MTLVPRMLAAAALATATLVAAPALAKQPPAKPAAAKLPAAPSLEAQGAWVREAPPGAEAMAAYLVVVNKAAAGLTLVGASSPQFREVQLHEVIEEAGMSKMVEAKALAVPGKGKLAFAPGSTHVMLIGPKKPLAVGDAVEIVFKTKEGPTWKVQTKVQPRGYQPGGAAAHDHGHEHHDHGGHDHHH